MRPAIDLHQATDVEVGVTLCGREPRVSQEFLNRAQIGTRLEQMRGERVSERVRADPLRDRRLPDIASDDPIDAARGQSPATEIQEQGLTAR